MEKPTMKQRLDAIGSFIWDTSDKDHPKVLGRGGRSWAEIGIFYLIYYACLISFFAATLAVFYETVSDTEPKLQSDSSLLDGNPGLGFRPRVDLDEPKIKAKAVKGKNKAYKEALDDFLAEYDKQLDNTDCAQHNETRKGEKEPCSVNYDELIKHCHPDTDYGFAEGKPCVIVKLNKVFGWTPKLWDSKPEAMDWLNNYSPDVIPVRCQAKEKKDAADLGPIKYYPQQGFPVRYYPFENQKDYRAPIVFVKFEDMERDKTIEVECRAHAKNIDYDRTEMQGSTQFKLYIHKN